MMNHSIYPKWLMTFFVVGMSIILLGCNNESNRNSEKVSGVEQNNTTDKKLDVGISIDKTSNNIYQLNITSQGDIAEQKLVSFSGVAIACTGYQQISSENQFNISDYALNDMVIFNGERVGTLQSVSSASKVTAATFRCNNAASLKSLKKSTSVVFQGNKVFSGKQIGTM